MSKHTWFSMDSFFGIEVPLSKVGFLRRRICRGRFPGIDVHLIEVSGDCSKMEDNILKRCRGFLGFVWQSSLVEDLLEMGLVMHRFITENEAVLKRCGIENFTISWRLGIYHDVRDFLEYLPDLSETECE